MMSQLEIVQDCLPCFVWNLFVPALAWALVIAGLTWTIRVRVRDNQPEPRLDGDPLERTASGTDRGTQQSLESAFCCSLLASSQPSMRGEKRCMQKK